MLESETSLNCLTLHKSKNTEMFLRKGTLEKD